MYMSQFSSQDLHLLVFAAAKGEVHKTLWTLGSSLVIASLSLLGENAVAFRSGDLPSLVKFSLDVLKQYLI